MSLGAVCAASLFDRPNNIHAQQTGRSEFVADSAGVLMKLKEAKSHEFAG
jgi:hypothetical protein